MSATTLLPGTGEPVLRPVFTDDELLLVHRMARAVLKFHEAGVAETNSPTRDFPYAVNSLLPALLRDAPEQKVRDLLNTMNRNA